MTSRHGIPTSLGFSSTSESTDSLCSVGIGDVMAWLELNTLGLGLALMAQGFKKIKPKPWAELWHSLGSASA